MAHLEPLKLNFAAKFFKMLGQQFLLASMPGEPLGRGPIAQSCLRYSYARAPLKGMSSKRKEDTAGAGLSSWTAVA